MIIQALRERRQAFHHFRGGEKKRLRGGDEGGSMKTKEGSKDILLPNDTDKQRRELTDTGTNTVNDQTLTT